MFPFPSFLAPSHLGIVALNRLLRREPWARQRLQRHAGKTVVVVWGSHRSLCLAIAPDGLLSQTSAVSQPDVRFILPAGQLASLPFLYQEGGPQAVIEQMQIHGDAGLTQAIADLAGSLRYDIEDDLASVFGDLAAVRLVSLARSLRAGAQGTGRRCAENLAAYLVYEQRELVDKTIAAGLKNRVDTLQSRLQALEHSISQLEYRQSIDSFGQTPP